MRKLIASAFVLLVVIGCASTYNVTLTGYGGQKTYPVKTYDFVLSPGMESDLEVKQYFGMLEKQLACIGWERDKNNHNFTIAPTFGINNPSAHVAPSSGVSIGGAFGIMGGNMGTGLSVGTFMGSPSDSTSHMEYTKFLDIKLFANGANAEPVWEGKIFSSGQTKTVAEVMPVLIKYAVDNFGKDTDGSKEFVFSGSEENMKALKTCPKR